MPATAASAPAVWEAMAAATGVALRVPFEYRGPQSCWARVWVMSYSVGEHVTVSHAAVAARLSASHWQVRLFAVVKAQGF